MIVGKLLGRLQPARVHRGPARQALETIAVKRTRAGKRIGGEVVWEPHVPHLRMDEAVHQASVHHAAAADPSADGQIDERIETLRRTPTPLGQGSGVDVGVEADGHVERRAEGARDVHVRPARLRRRRDEAVAGRARVAGPPGRRRRCPPRQSARGDRRPRGRSRRACCKVASGVVVGNRTCSRTSPGPAPTMHTNLVPPASTAPNSGVIGLRITAATPTAGSTTAPTSQSGLRANNSSRSSGCVG